MVGHGTTAFCCTALWHESVAFVLHSIVAMEWMNEETLHHNATHAVH